MPPVPAAGRSASPSSSCRPPPRLLSFAWESKARQKNPTTPKPFPNYTAARGISSPRDVTGMLFFEGPRAETEGPGGQAQPWADCALTPEGFFKKEFRAINASDPTRYGAGAEQLPAPLAAWDRSRDGGGR